MSLRSVVREALYLPYQIVSPAFIPAYPGAVHAICA